MPNVDNIQDIKLENIKKDDDSLVFDEMIKNKDKIEIKREDVEKAINEDLEWLWGQFKGKNIDQLKKVVNESSNDEEVLQKSENLFDTWINANPNVIQNIEFGIFAEKKIDNQKEEALKKYLTAETLDLNKEKVKIELESLQVGVVDTMEKFPEYLVSKYTTLNILNADTSANSMKAKFEKAMEGVDEKEKISFEQFAKNIHGVVDTYFSDLKQLNIDKNVLENMNTGVQFALMNGLHANGNSDFFDIFNAIGEGKEKWKIDKKDAILGLFNAFKNGKNYLDLGIQLENLKAHLQENTAKCWNCSGVAELSNPVNFMNALHAKLFTDKVNIQLTAGKPEQLTSEQTKQLQDIANQIDLDKEKILKINTSTVKAQELLWKRVEWKENISETYASLQETMTDVMGSLDWVLSIFWIGGGGKYLIDQLWEGDSFIRKVANFFLGLLGFSGGLQGVHKDYIKNNINKWIELQPEKKDFITSALKYYQNPANKEKHQWEKTTFEMIPWLEALKKADDEQLKKEIDNKQERTLKLTDKIPSNYGLLVDSLENAIKEYPSSVSTDVLKNEKFVHQYLKKAIPELMKNQKFMNTITSPDDFAFALMGNLVLDHFFVEGVALGLEDTSKYWGVEKVENSDDKKESEITKEEAKKKYWETPAVVNFNPWNLRNPSLWPVDENKFTIFDTPQEWYNALVNQINSAKTGTSKNYTPDMTLQKFFNIYAPASDNNKPNQYAKDVAKFIGGYITDQTMIKDIDTKKFAEAIAKHEDWNCYKMLKDLQIIA